MESVTVSETFERFLGASRLTLSPFALSAPFGISKHHVSPGIHLCAGQHCALTSKMTDPTRQSDALLTEHFQYTPLVGPCGPYRITNAC